MNKELLQLEQLKNHAGYKLLEDMWRERLAGHQEKRDKAAQRGSETAWRYWAGIEKGFQDAATLLPLTLLQMEKDEDNQRAEERFEEIAQELKGDKNGS